MDRGERLILEGLNENTLRNSRNKYSDDQFEANYAKAKAEGKFRLARHPRIMN